jgi:hypothetical protein
MISFNLWYAKRKHKVLLYREEKVKIRQLQLDLAKHNAEQMKEELNVALAKLTNEEFQQFGEDCGYLIPKKRKGK